MKAREFLYNNLKDEASCYFGNTDEKWLSRTCNAWMDDELNSKHHYELMKLIVGDEKLKRLRILDMASGCGTFVFYGLKNGYDVYGVDPAKWKHQFNLMKIKENGYPIEWIDRIFSGVGEKLPFTDGTFNIISTYQTLEHVQSHKKCFEEFKRVLKQGGYLFIKCPDYTSFFEGHYRIPMLPFMNRLLFNFYLKILKKPTKGLKTINYISKNMIIKFIGNDYYIQDINIMQIKERILKKINIKSDILAHVYLKYRQLKRLFTYESSVNLVAIKK